MSRILLLLFCFSIGFVHAQNSSIQDSLPKLSLRKMVRPYPLAKKNFRQYKTKVISGSIVGASGILVLSHSLGSISQNKPHQWEFTAGSLALIGSGLWITKGAKEKRKNAMRLVPKNKTEKRTLKVSPSGIVLRF